MKLKQPVGVSKSLLRESSHLYLYSAFNNTNCVKATAQYQNRNIFELNGFHY